MDAARETHYFGNAWRSVKATKNLFGKLCLLALIQFVPVLGQIVALGYFLGWAREAAWGMETPLPAHVFGRDDPGFWARGAKAFAIQILYSLIIGVFSSVITMLGVVLAGALNASEALFAGIEGACGVLTLVMCVLFGFVEVIGLVRMAIYDRFGAAFQWGACFKMLFHFFGGFVKLGFTYLLAGLLLCIAGCLVGTALVPGLGGTVLLACVLGVAVDGGGTATFELAGLVCGAFAVVCLATLVASFLLEVVTLFVEALMWRALGNVVARFDVPAWGGRFDKLPFECVGTPGTNPAQGASDAPQANGAAAEAGTAAEPTSVAAVDEGPAPSGAPEKRCHPLLVLLLSVLAAVLVSAGASAAVLFLPVEDSTDAATWESIQDAAGQFAEDFSDALDEIEDELDAAGIPYPGGDMDELLSLV